MSRPALARSTSCWTARAWSCSGERVGCREARPGTAAVAQASSGRRCRRGRDRRPRADRRASWRRGPGAGPARAGRGRDRVRDGGRRLRRRAHLRRLRHASAIRRRMSSSRPGRRRCQAQTRATAASRASVKEWRAVATRCERTAHSFMGVLCLAAAADWIKLQQAIVLSCRHREEAASGKRQYGFQTGPSLDPAYSGLCPSAQPSVRCVTRQKPRWPDKDEGPGA